MKSRIIFLVTFLVLLLAGEAFGQACKNVGAKECRVTTPGKCHWWVCDGQAKQWIFTGQSCTCPRSDTGLFKYALCDENELPGFVLAQKAYLCRDSENVRKIKEARDIEEESDEEIEDLLKQKEISDNFATSMTHT